tara:strand:- start:233 stop:937 length:705 start_codon:yes stop_codon:yes gene_type:complete
MAFKLKSGNKVDFKNMGSSPVRNMKDGYYSHSFEKSPMRNTAKDDPSNDPNYGAEKGNYDTPVDTEVKTANTDNTTDNSEQGTETGDLSNVVKSTTPVETETKTTDGSNLGDGLEDAKNSDEKKKLMDQSKKEMYANAWQNSGAGHITEAVKSIGRGIKNIRARRKAKKAEKSMSTDLNTDGIKLDTKKQKKAFRKNTVVKNGKTYDKSKKTPTDAELMAHHEANRKKQGKSTL